MNAPFLRWLGRMFVPLILLILGRAAVGEVTVTARVAWTVPRHLTRRDESGIVVWLTPVGALPEMKPPSGPLPKLVQKNKSFSPHLLVVPVGSVVEFPNHDPFFHNVFSLFEGKRFDLGLYEAGTSRNVRFDKPGISYIFCNIHAEMSAVVIALPTPYYGVSSKRGEIVIPNVPPGRYTMRLWYEAAAPAELDAQTRDVTIGENSATLGVLRLTPATPVQVHTDKAHTDKAHTDKYGGEYAPPEPDNPAYSR